MCKRKKFHIVLDIYKLTDSDIENVRHLNATECRKDSLKSKYAEVCVPKASGSSATC